jgi:GT2 family glycosyltransferase
MHAPQAGLVPRSGEGADGTIYVLLPVHNRRALTERFVRCLLEQSDQNYHLVLIDDGSSDGTSEMVHQLVPHATVLRGGGNWWWSGALQRGYNWLKAHTCGGNEIVLIANDDTSFDHTFLSTARAVLQRTPHGLLLAQLYSDKSDQLLEVGVSVDWRTMEFRSIKDTSRINCFSTRGLFLRVRDFLELGGFHPVLLPHYASDYEFTIRATRRGFVLISDPSVRLWFNEGTTGTHQVIASSVGSFLRRTFSKRTVTNPLYLTALVLLACPVRFMPLNALRIWRGFAGALLRSLRGS